MSVLVIARFDEDTTWTQWLPSNWTPLIVQKDRDLPNRGREPASFLWAILERLQVKPDDVFGFVQADPFSHTVNLYEQLTQPVIGFAPLRGDARYGMEPLWSDGVGNPHHPGVPVARLYERWFGGPFPGTVPFWPGGQFVTTGETLLRYPESLYRRMFEDLLDEDDLAPYALERLWPTIFTIETTEGVPS